MYLYIYPANVILRTANKKSLSPESTTCIKNYQFLGSQSSTSFHFDAELSVVAYVYNKPRNRNLKKFFRIWIYTISMACITSWRPEELRISMKCSTHLKLPWLYILCQEIFQFLLQCRVKVALVQARSQHILSGV